MNESRKVKSKETQDKSFRVQLSDELRNKIEQIAKNYDCYYGEKASMSKFLAKIATGQLIIRESIPWQADREKNNYLIDLHVDLPSNLNGLIYEITKIFGKNNINICRAISRENNNYARFTLSCPKNVDMSNIFQEIKDIDLKKVFNLNDNNKIYEFIKKIDDSDKPIKREDELKDENTRNFIVHKYGNQKIIKEIYLLLRFKIEIDNKPNELKELLKEIVKKRISIVSINVNTKTDGNGEQKTNLVNLLIGFYLFSDINISQEKIDKEHTIEELINFFERDLKDRKLAQNVIIVDVNDDYCD
jgi:prephenate dehydratase